MRKATIAGLLVLALAPLPAGAQDTGWRGPPRGGQGAEQGGWQRRERPAAAPSGGWQRPAPAATPGAEAGQRRWRPSPDRGRAWADRRDFERDRARFYDRQDWANRPAPAGGWGRNSWERGGWDRGSWGGAGGWNRGWRQDRRYDWGGYRAAHRGVYRLPRYRAPYGWNDGYRAFAIGALIAAPLFAQDYWIDDPYAFRLPEAYGPYRWVRYHDDALLVDVETGEVVDVVERLFW